MNIWKDEKPASYLPLAEYAANVRTVSREEFARLRPGPVLVVGGATLIGNPRDDFMTLSTPALHLDPLHDPNAFVVPVVKRSDTFPGIVWVGRDRPCDVWLPVQSVSKLHAQFVVKPGGGMELMDAGSKNGTFLNGKKLVDKKPAAPVEGDLIRFGHYDVRFFGPAGLWEFLRQPGG